MSSRIIINNKTDLPDIKVLQIVAVVINRGRVSNDGKRYAYSCTFYVDNINYVLVTGLRKKSDVFTIVKGY